MCTGTVHSSIAPSGVRVYHATLASLRMKDCCYRVVEIKVYETEKSSWMKEEEEEEEEEEKSQLSSHIRTVVVYK